MLALAVPSLSSVAASAASRPVEQLLPGVVSGTGNDGRTITVRDLLQHTSGLSDYIYDVFPGPSAQTYFANRWRAYQPEELVALALRHGPDFPAGTRWAYSNTNYVLAGMIIEKITGRTWEQQVHDRILRPLRLQHTDTPGTKPFLPHPHAANYQQFALDGPMVDTTIPYRPFDSGADGSMTGTARDLNRFFTALANGRLLRPAEFAAMRPTVAVPQDSGHPAGTRDGLGLFFTPCPAATVTSGMEEAASDMSSGPRQPQTADVLSPSPRTAAPRTRRPLPVRKTHCATSSTTLCAAPHDHHALDTAVRPFVPHAWLRRTLHEQRATVGYVSSSCRCAFQRRLRASSSLRGKCSPHLPL